MRPSVTAQSWPNSPAFAVEVAVEEQAAADAGAEVEVDEVAGAAAAADPAFADGRGRAVLLDHDGAGEAAFEQGAQRHVAQH
jgi:hypothetical protein